MWHNLPRGRACHDKVANRDPYGDLRPRSQPATDRSHPIETLRDRKREQNRAATVEAAWRLFIAHGYDHVTVHDICAAADIAPRTFHRYFAAKEDVVAEPVRRMTAIAHDHITAAPPGTPDADVLRRAMLAVGRFVIDHRELLTGLRTVARESTHLRGTQPGVRPDEEAAIAELLRARTQIPTTQTPKATSEEPIHKQQQQRIPEPLRSRPGQGAARPLHPRPPERHRRLLVACTIAAFRVWYDEYLRLELQDPLTQLDEILHAVHIEPGHPLV
ncbi:TetR/AcrR family transcriptional regulator [Dactylosporangium sp. NPDC051541]|uniref:TetR/AcrR family transcriptional regulator n=1 Tax=Dactylosporangium sp. NPDC051541 TaxID=3363977 RepID=UPI003787C1D2